MLLGGAFLFIYFVDPFQYFHKHLYGFSDNQRYQNIGLINSYLNSEDGYDSVIIGTSLSENFYPENVNRAMKWGKTLKLCASGAVPVEQKTVLLKAIETGKVKNVLWEVASHKFSSTKIQENDGLSVHAMPYQLYSSGFGTLHYLLNGHVFKEAWKLYFNQTEYVNKNLETYANWNKLFTSYVEAFSSYKNLIALGSKVEKESIGTGFNLESVKSYPEIDLNLLPMIRKYRDINFYLYIPPYSKVHFLGKTNEDLSRVFMMYAYILKKTSGFDNVKLYGFDLENFTADLSNYRDSIHYMEKINQLMIHKISRKENELTGENVNQYLFRFYKDISLFKKTMYQKYLQQEKLTRQRLLDLKSIKQALSQYYNDFGEYPHSVGFDGLYTKWGRSGKKWITGLAPKYISNLPRDPRELKDPGKQYYYKSDGHDYKLISHQVEDCQIVESKLPERIDPERRCWAYGYWTKGAKSW